jgi:hypothetical protein
MDNPEENNNHQARVVLQQLEKNEGDSSMGNAGPAKERLEQNR